MMSINKYETGVTPNWCPGCGNFGLWQALKQALVELKLDPGETVLVAGIGCHGHINNFTKTSSFEGLHGRPIPLATGMKLVNPKLNVIVATGDGDCLGEGGNHLIHAARRNHNLTVLIHDNASYSLTTGQASPASPQGYRSKSTPGGKIEERLNPLTLSLAAGATFVSRGFAGDISHLAQLIKAAINHRGLAVVDILQPCVVFNQEYTFEYYREWIKKLTQPSSQRQEAFGEALKWGPKIPIGIFYQEKGLSYEEKIKPPAKSFDWLKLTKEFY